MKVFHSVTEVPGGFGPSAVTIGKFDGVHSGHRAVVGRLREVAAERGLTAVVVTFDRNPLELIAPDECPASVVSNGQKLDLLEGTGIDATLMVAFDRALAGLEPEEFVRRILVDRLRAAVVLVGGDFRFGHRGAGDVTMLRELGSAYGFTVELIDDVRPEHGRRVSSTWIRELLADGDVAHAAELLGYAPTVRGLVVRGAARGRELGFPTANLSPELEGLIPADGVYAGWLTDDGDRYEVAISVGNNPTFEGVAHRQVEAYVLDRELDLYDHRVEVSFVQRIRGMVAYHGVEPLIAQIADDVERVRDILSAESV